MVSLGKMKMRLSYVFVVDFLRSLTLFFSECVIIYDSFYVTSYTLNVRVVQMFE